MGIDVNTLKFLMAARRSGVDARRTITIGRQHLYVEHARLSELLGSVRNRPTEAACDAFRESEWYQVSDPVDAGPRVQIVGPYPVMLLVQAGKTAAIEPFRSMPQQSDYEAAWRGQAESGPAHGDPHSLSRWSLRDIVQACVPAPLARRIRDARSARRYPAELFRRQLPKP